MRRRDAARGRRAAHPMKDTVSARLARTGRVYVPAPVGRALGDDEPCPTLYRWPGAGPLHQALSTALDTLGPPGAPTLWLSDDPNARAPGGVGRFGALV